MGIAAVKDVFIVHGWTYSIDKWTDIVDELKNKGLNPILLRVPGLTEPSDKIWDIEGYVEWLDGKLRGHDSPVVVGHSNGGRIAIAYAAAHPDQLGRLILIDSAGVPLNETKAKAKLRTLKGISKVGKVLQINKISLVKKVFYKVIGARDYMEAPANMKATMQNMLHADQTLRPSAVKVPTTIIWGRDDSITPLADGETLRDAIKGAELHVIDGARHSPFATQPDKIADIIFGAIK